MASSNSPNMSYCMVENTNLALGQILDHVYEADSTNEFVNELNSYEKKALPKLIEKMEELLQLFQDMEDEEEVEEDE